MTREFEPDVEPFDLIVIGSGPAGEKAAAKAAYLGKRIALVERSQRSVGGVAVTRLGMVPTKTLRESALYLTGFRKREIYGASVQLEPSAIHIQLSQRTDDVSASMSRAVRENVARHQVELVTGTATLRPDHHVVVETPRGFRRVLRGEAVLIATGSRPFHPPGIPFEDPDVFDCERVLEIGSTPASVVIVGGGAIGCEHASIFTALGTKVTLIDGADRLLGYVDAELSRDLRRIFESMGMEVRLGVRIDRVTRDSDGLVVALDDGSEVRPERLLFASGRSGNTEGLGLEQVGVEVDSRGRIVVDDRYRTTAAGIYAAGDVIGPPALASAAMEQGRIAVCDAFGVQGSEALDAVIPTGVYSIPEVAGVGLTEQEAARQRIDYEVGPRTLLLQRAREHLRGDRGARQARVPPGRPDRDRRPHPGRGCQRAHPYRAVGDPPPRHNRLLPRHDIQRADVRGGLQGRRVRRAPAARGDLDLGGPPPVVTGPLRRLPCAGSAPGPPSPRTLAAGRRARAIGVRGRELSRLNPHLPPVGTSKMHA